MCVFLFVQSQHYYYHHFCIIIYNFILYFHIYSECSFKEREREQLHSSSFISSFSLVHIFLRTNFFVQLYFIGDWKYKKEEIELTVEWKGVFISIVFIIPTSFYLVSLFRVSILFVSLSLWKVHEKSTFQTRYLILFNWIERERETSEKEGLGMIIIMVII